MTDVYGYAADTSAAKLHLSCVQTGTNFDAEGADGFYDGLRQQAARAGPSNV